MISRAAVLAKAREWVGMLERTGNNDIWFADDWGITGYSWCGAFVQSCFYYADPSPKGALPHTSMYVPYWVQWARDHSQAIEVGKGSPLPGDVLFFSWDMVKWGRNTPGTGDHVGIVESYDGGDTVNTIEGNIGSPQGVYRKSRSITGTVICFWRPTVYADDTLGPASDPEELTVADVTALTAQISALGTYAREQFDYIKPFLEQGRVGFVDDVVVDTNDRVKAMEQAIAALGGEAPPPAKPDPSLLTTAELLAELGRRVPSQDRPSPPAL